MVTYTNEERAVANGTENPRKVNATSICPTDICFWHTFILIHCHCFPCTFMMISDHQRILEQHQLCWMIEVGLWNWLIKRSCNTWGFGVYRGILHILSLIFKPCHLRWGGYRSCHLTEKEIASMLKWYAQRHLFILEAGLEPGLQSPCLWSAPSQEPTLEFTCILGYLGTESLGN